MIVIDGTWETLNSLTACSIVDTTIEATCSVSGKIFTVSHFTSFPAMTATSLLLTHISPPFNGGLSEAKTLVLSITTLNADGDTIDEYANIAADRVTVETASEPSLAEVVEFSTVPPNAGVENVDFHMRFKLHDNVPGTGVITVTFPMPI